MLSWKTRTCDSLCAIISQWNPFKSLSTTCSTFPRITHYQFHLYLYTSTNCLSTNSFHRKFYHLIFYSLYKYLELFFALNIIIRKKYCSTIMAIRMPRIINAKPILRRSSSLGANVPKGYFAVYVGEQEKKRFVIPVSFLNQPSFQDLLSQFEEEFGFNHPMGGLTITCREDIFVDLTSRLSGFWVRPRAQLS